MKLSLSGVYSVLTAADGEDAWKLIPEELPDMVISDVMMPITDGITLCRRIKGDIRTSHIPVILLTAKSAKDSQLVGLEAGADDYISKPFNMEMLLEGAAFDRDEEEDAKGLYAILYHGHRLDGGTS